jgi:hypothetical protein
VPVRVDRPGAISSAPPLGVDARCAAATGALDVLAVGAAVLGGIWFGVRRFVRRSDTAGWEREWAQVEPQWNGRTP